MIAIRRVVVIVLWMLGTTIDRLSWRLPSLERAGWRYRVALAGKRLDLRWGTRVYATPWALTHGRSVVRGMPIAARRRAMLRLMPAVAGVFAALLLFAKRKQRTSA